MKLAHKSQFSASERLSNAKALEAEGKYEKASAEYEKLLKIFPKDQFIYERLMILYRKQKDYKKEKATILAGIKVFSKLHQPAKSSNRKIASLSRALLKFTGLVDKNGNPVFEQQPIGKWKKRLDGLVKKLEK